MFCVLDLLVLTCPLVFFSSICSNLSCSSSLNASESASVSVSVSDTL